MDQPHDMDKIDEYMCSMYVSMHAGAYVYAMTDRNACDSLTEDSFSGLCHKDYIENICVPVNDKCQ